MSLFNTPDQVISAFLVWIFGFFIIEKSRVLFNINIKIAYILYIWHSSFSFMYAVFTLTHSSDATVYYMSGLNGVVDFGAGTQFIKYFTSLFISFFNLSYLGLFMVFNLLGSIGLLAFYSSLSYATIDRSSFIKRLVTIAVFLPSISFWSSSIGKDSIVFMSVNLILWATLNLKGRIFLFMISIILIGFIRPHIAGILLIAFFSSLILSKSLGYRKKIILFFVSLGALLFIVPYSLEYSGLGNTVNITTVKEYIETRQASNQEGGSSIDITSISLAEKLFTYLFRPLPFEAHTIHALFSSLDNLFLLSLALLFTIGVLKRTRYHKNYNLTFLLLYSLISWFILANLTANLGIAVRQKIMFLPFLIFLAFLYIPNIVLRRNNANE